jgi:hypothetical protein
MAITLERPKATNLFRIQLPGRASAGDIAYVGLGSMGSLWNDILDAGGDWLRNKLESSGISGQDIVEVQNQVGATMNSLADQYYVIRDSGQLTVALVSQFQQAFQTVINSFCNHARSIGSSRALNGCTTIQFYGGKWIADREAEKMNLANTGHVGNVQNTVIDPVTGLPINFTNPPGAVSTITQYMPLVLGAVFVFAMFKSSKSW